MCVKQPDAWEFRAVTYIGWIASIGLSRYGSAVAKPAARTSDRCQLTRYGFLDERIVFDALIVAAIGNNKSASRLFSAISGLRAVDRQLGSNRTPGEDSSKVRVGHNPPGTHKTRSSWGWKCALAIGVIRGSCAARSAETGRLIGIYVDLAQVRGSNLDALNHGNHASKCRSFSFGLEY